MDYTWQNWLQQWRTIADNSESDTYLPIMITVDTVHYELLRISKFNREYDEEKPHILTSIRDFNDKTAILSRATRDLGIVRVITKKHTPTFIIEPGADVLKWISKNEGVSAGKLVKIMRSGDIGRRIRRRDRKTAKDLHEKNLSAEQKLKAKLEQQEEIVTALNFELEQSLIYKRRLLEEVNEMKRQRSLMEKNIIEKNNKLSKFENEPHSSGTMVSSIGVADQRGIKVLSNKPLPGNFGG